MEDQGSAFNHFKFNPDANYGIPTKWDKKINVEDFSKLKIFVNETDSFQASNLNIFTNYVLSFFNDESIQKWLGSCDMSFYQNQLNFAVWCASSGCGVSSKDHLNARDNLLASVFKFHFYYQTRKILEEMSCPIPGESIFKTMDNNINMIKYKKLCNEFGVRNNTDFRFKGGDNGGLGTMYNYVSNIGYRPLKGVTYISSKFQFIEQTTSDAIKIDYVKQDLAMEGWKQFMIEESQGFTKAGIIRLDDSIRTYVYCILGSQAQTRSSILTSKETQQYFVDLLEQNIKSQFSIPESITKYEESITKTNSKIDYVVGIGLYMMPTDLVLKVGSIQKYNNNIVIANDDVRIGHNENLNSTEHGNVHAMVVSTPVAHFAQNTNQIIKTNEEFQVNGVYLAIAVTAVSFIFCYTFLSKNIRK